MRRSIGRVSPPRRPGAGVGTISSPDTGMCPPWAGGRPRERLRDADTWTEVSQSHGIFMFPYHYL